MEDIILIRRRMLSPSRPDFFSLSRELMGKSSHPVLLFNYFLVVAFRYRASLDLVIDEWNAISLVRRIYVSNVAR